MATHRFPVNVPNPTAAPVSALLLLDPEKPENLRHLRLHFHPAGLEVLSAFITTDQCAEKGGRELKVDLKPHSSTTVYVVVNTAPSAKPGGAYFNLVDTRNAKAIGGVLVVVQEPSIPTGPGHVIDPKNPCPAKLETDIYVVESNTTPITPLPKSKISINSSLELVARITNPTDKPLTHVTVYLEHLGNSTIKFVPGCWNVGTLQPKEIFYATWSIKFNPGQNLIANASIVVASRDKDPVRLHGNFEFGEKGR